MAQKNKIRIGFVGCGEHARKSIYPAIRHTPIDFVAVCNRHGGDILRRTARNFGVLRRYTDYQKMIQKEHLDALFVVTGPDSYPRISIDAMEAGLHVFIEKPPANTVGEVKEMIRTSERTGKFLMIAFKKRFVPAYMKAKEIMNIPEFGKPTSILSRYSSKVDKERIENYQDKEERPKDLFPFVLDYVIHHVDLIRFFMGDVERIYFERNFPKGIPTYAISIKFKSGAVGVMHITKECSPTSFQERVELVGEGANIIIDNCIRLIYYQRSKELSWDNYIGEDTQAPQIWEPAFSLSQFSNKALFLEGFVGEVRHFAESILNNTPPQSNIYDGLEAMKFIEALYSKPGNVIKL